MNQEFTCPHLKRMARQKTGPWPGATPFWPTDSRPKSLRASEVAPGHGFSAALTFLVGKSAIQPASRLDGKPAGKAAASSYDLRYGGQLTCL